MTDGAVWRNRLWRRLSYFHIMLIRFWAEAFLIFGTSWWLRKSSAQTPCAAAAGTVGRLHSKHDITELEVVCFHSICWRCCCYSFMSRRRCGSMLEQRNHPMNSNTVSHHHTYSRVHEDICLFTSNDNQQQKWLWNICKVIVYYMFYLYKCRCRCLHLMLIHYGESVGGVSVIGVTEPRGKIHQNDCIIYYADINIGNDNRTKTKLSIFTQNDRICLMHTQRL